MSVFHENMLIGSSGQGAPAAAGISRSLRFNSSDSVFCSRAVSTTSTRKIFTISAWVKRSRFSTGGFQAIYNADTFKTDFFGFNTSTDQIRVFISGADNGDVSTAAVFRDPSAWYHILFSIDTTQVTPSNRIRVYVNGTEQTLSGTFPVQDYVFTKLFNTAYTQYIGRCAGDYGDFYLAEYFCIDGQALTPSSFTEVSATTGQLVPKQYSGSYGTNGFKLDFSDNSAATAAALGKDTSGNGNHWTPNNLSINTGGPTSVAAASGALPIYNTTDTYGATKGSGTRTDANASSLSLAIPMDGANNGTTFTDESATIKGSGSAKTLTRNGDTKTVTSVSKFYGSSGYFDGTGDNLSFASDSSMLFGTGDFTVECWINASNTSSIQNVIGNYQSATGWNLALNNQVGVGYSQGRISFSFGDSPVVESNAGVFTAGSWHHVAVTRSGTTAKIFFNGIEVGSATSSANNSTGNSVFGIAYDPALNRYFTGYLQDLRVYKGAAKYTANFNPPSTTQNATVGAGNDSLVDTPTSYGTDTGAGGEVRGNYATWNPLAKGTTHTLSNGNLDVSPSGHGTTNATIAVTAGSKVYMEFTRTGGTEGGGWGFTSNLTPYSSYPGTPSNVWWVYDNGGNFSYHNNGSSTEYGSKTTNGQTLQLAIDYDAGKAWIGINNTWFTTSNATTGNPGTGANPTFTFTTSLPLFPLVEAAGWTVSCNFGQRPFAYTAPSGFKALCDTNLPAPVVAKSSDYFQTVLYTGNGSTQTISGLGFSPDLVWAKSRSAATNHGLIDTVRGRGFILVSDLTVADQISPAGADLASFDANGFTLGAPNAIPINVSGQTYVAWCWDAGTTTASNPDGSITSSVRANASAGFSIVSFSSGSAGNYTVGHGLGAKPHFIITKARNGSTFNWSINHISIATTVNKYLAFTTSATLDNGAAVWGANLSDTNSTTFGISSANAVEANKDCIAYCFAPVAGYSSFGSYTGNGSTDGPFVYTGHRVRWLLVKNATNGGSWVLHDTARSTYNVSGQELLPDSSGAEYTFTRFDFLSNGFKGRSTNNASNTNGDTYIYAAFAESPFQFSRAR